MFAAELASAVRPDEYRGDLPTGLVLASEQAAAAALARAACLSGFAEMVQTLAALIRCRPGPVAASARMPMSGRLGRRQPW
jgi:hypothetical protein